MQEGGEYVPAQESAVAVEGKEIDAGRESAAAQSRADQAASGGEKTEPAEKAEKVEAKEDAGKKAVPESLKKKTDDTPPWLRERISHYAAESKALKAQLEEMRRELEATRQPANKPPRQPGVPPRQEDYDSYTDYVKDHTEFIVSQREAAWKKQQEAHEFQQESTRQASEFKSHIDKFAQGFADPRAVISAMTADELPVTDTMGQAIMALGEKGAEVLFQLAQDPAKAYRLAQMPPAQVYMQIGMMAASQPSAPAPQQMSQSQPAHVQPRPIPSIRGGAGGVQDDSPKESDSAAEWARKHAAESMKRNPGLKMYYPRGA